MAIVAWDIVTLFLSRPLEYRVIAYSYIGVYLLERIFVPHWQYFLGVLSIFSFTFVNIFYRLPFTLPL